jgi:dihydrofolate reductase
MSARSRSGSKLKAQVPTRRRTARRRGATGSGRVHLYVGLSLDGYLAAPDGGIDWLTRYDDALEGFGGFVKTIGSMVMGRATYDWGVAHGPGAFGRTPAYVVTHRPLSPRLPSVTPFSGDLAQLVADLRSRHAGDIWLMGGGELTRAFLDADLVDIWSIAFVPTLIGSGIPMFPPRPAREQRLRLVHVHHYPSGTVALRYER